ncbi:MAG: YHS domain-containing protein [Bacteroidota bacterium]|nr:YHS domain-containing protein [Bacteroidota bacterium]
MYKIIYLSVFIIAVFFSVNSKTFSDVNSVNSDSTQYCPVGGEKIEGAGVAYQYLNQEVKFCCEGCEASFKKNPAKYLKGASLRCPVCDEDDAKKTISTVNNGVKYYFCGKGCKSKFNENPDSYLNNYKNQINE